MRKWKWVIKYVLGLFFLQLSRAKGYPTYKICTQKPFHEESFLIFELVRSRLWITASGKVDFHWRIGMNKQQLASRIWEAANRMRSKIEAHEYKDYILGFIFYKFLSDKEMKFFINNHFKKEDIQALSEAEIDDVKFIKENVGYFISYDHLFSTWIEMGSDFDVSNVRDALSAFNRNINPSHKKVFEKIFDTLQTGLSKLGDSSSSQTKAIRDLIQLIKVIPMDGRQSYDVLGFIYEYLISKFAANAGKKAGEFYTPHEVSFLMSEIVADHLKGEN